MDIERLKKMVWAAAIGMGLGYLSVEIAFKAGFSEFQAMLCLLGTAVAYGVFLQKKEDKEQEVAIQEFGKEVDQYIDKEVERRSKDAEERAEKAEERCKKVVRQAQVVIGRHKENRRP